MNSLFPGDCGDVKAYLASYRQAQHGITLQLAELRRLQSLEAEVGAAVARRAHAVGRIRSLEAQAADAISRLCILRQEIETVIGRVAGDTLREVLHRHYIQGETLDEIAAALHYTNRHVARLHKKALQQITLPAPESP